MGYFGIRPMDERQFEQARLAKALVDSLGLDGAISACRANGWDGVLKYLIGYGEAPAAGSNGLPRYQV